MALVDGADARVVIKAYATGVISSNSQPVSSSDPAATGGQVLRRVSSTLSLQKDTYQAAEIRNDRQVVDYRHGVKRVSGSISGEYSPNTYEVLMEAATRGTWAAAVTATQSDFTSAAADNATSKFTFAGGNPVTKGYRVGMIVRFTGLSDTDNNSKNFLITAFGGSNNREVTVYPAPDSMTADTSFSMASLPYLMVPSSSLVSRKFAVEHYYEDSDISQLFTECRVGGMNIALPATGMATIEFPMMGRDLEVASGGSAPFFSSPTAETTTGIFQAVNGLIKVGGSTVGVVTGININMALNPSGEAVVGQNFIPEVHLGRAVVTGQMTAFLEDSTFIENFKDEDEVSVLIYLTTSSAPGAAATSIYMPRVKFTSADNPLQGEAGQTITLNFAALKYVGSGAGIDTTTIAICDTEVTA